MSVDHALIPSSPVASQFLSSLLSILSVPLALPVIIIEDLSQLTVLSCLSHNNGTNLCDIVFGGFLCMQFRRNGDPYLIHCVETAVILAATGAGSEVVAAGLLHDAVDDSNLSQQFLRYALGDDIADLVTGVSEYSSSEAFVPYQSGNHLVCLLKKKKKFNLVLEMIFLWNVQSGFKIK